jgi:hypothetical protein
MNQSVLLRTTGVGPYTDPYESTGTMKILIPIVGFGRTGGYRVSSQVAVRCRSSL